MEAVVVGAIVVRFDRRFPSIKGDEDGLEVFISKVFGKVKSEVVKADAERKKCRKND
jgi:hypothetical protein